MRNLFLFVLFQPESIVLNICFRFTESKLEDDIQPTQHQFQWWTAQPGDDTANAHPPTLCLWLESRQHYLNVKLSGAWASMSLLFVSAYPLWGFSKCSRFFSPDIVYSQDIFVHNRIRVCQIYFKECTQFPIWFYILTAIFFFTTNLSGSPTVFILVNLGVHISFWFDYRPILVPTFITKC